MSEQTSIWKKELHLRRAFRPAARPAPAPTTTSIWKRELHLRKQPSVPGPAVEWPTPKRAELWTEPSEPAEPLVQVEPEPDAKPSHKVPVKKLVGLRIGSSGLAAAHIANNGSAELLQLAHATLEPGVVSGGEVRDPEALARALKAFFAKNKLPRRDVRLGIASNRIGVRILEVPAIEDPKLFANAVRFRAQELLPIPVTEAVLDHVVLDTSDSEDGAICRVLLVFAHRELVDRYVEACRRAHVKLVGIDFEAFALLRALSEPGPADHAVVVVAIGAERTILAVSEGAVCDYTRVLEWGGSSLDTALGAALDLDPTEAAQIKATVPLLRDAEHPALAPVRMAAARAAIREELQSLSRELVSSLQFYQGRPGSLEIGELLLTGGGAHLDGIGPELEALLGVPVRIGEPLARLKVGKKLKPPAELGSLAIAVGLGIED